MSSVGPGPAAGTPGRGPGRASRVERQVDRVWWATVLGVFVAVLGVIDGASMAARRRETPCGEDSFGPCYVHPRAGIGAGIVVICLLLALLIMLAGMIARAVLDPQPPEQPGADVP